MQPVRTFGQTIRPDDGAIAGVALAVTCLPLRDDPGVPDDFPVQRQFGGGFELGSCGLARPDHHRLPEKPVRGPYRQRIENDLQCRGIRHMAVTLTVHEFGLNTQLSGSGEKVHSARHLHTTGRSRREFHIFRNRIAVFNALATPPFPGNQCPANGFVYSPERLLSRKRNGTSFPMPTASP